MGILRKVFKPMFDRDKWKILRGDKVMIVAGKDKGQIGTVLKVIRDQQYPRVVVEGLNLSKRSIKRTQDNPGGIVSVESPLHYSNVSLLDPVTNAPVKIAWRYLEDGTKVRITRGRLASGSVIPRPDILTQRKKPRPAEAGPQDTKVGVVDEVTHTPGDVPTALKALLEEEARQHGEAGGGSVGAAAAPPRFTTGRRGLVYQSGHIHARRSMRSISTTSTSTISSNSGAVRRQFSTFASAPLSWWWLL